MNDCIECIGLQQAAGVAQLKCYECYILNGEEEKTMNKHFKEITNARFEQLIGWGAK